MKQLTWKRADEFTKDCFNKWGYKPYQATLMAHGTDKNGVYYDFTI